MKDTSYHKLKKYRKALKYLFKAIHMLEEISSKYYLCYFWLETAQVLLKQGNPKSAREFALKCKNTSREIGRKDTMTESTALIEKLRSQKADHRHQVSGVR